MAEYRTFALTCIVSSSSRARVFFLTTYRHPVFTAALLERDGAVASPCAPRRRSAYGGNPDYGRRGTRVCTRGLKRGPDPGLWHYARKGREHLRTPACTRTGTRASTTGSLRGGRNRGHGPRPGEAGGARHVRLRGLGP